jgi:lipopolysaccharide/colanic/teichoic acid biosynthesis glycosyltransferase
MPAEDACEVQSAGVLEVRSGLPRSVDTVLAFLGLILLMPVIALSALAVAFFSGRPVIFRQSRVGQDGRLFDLYKLRTMRTSTAGPQITSGDDIRITRLGRLLRQTKLDELPTLWNVLRGDMSMVGPRPEVPRFVNFADPIWQRVLAARPGITDPVTLVLRNEADMLARIEGDTEQYYVRELQPAKLKGYVAYLNGRTWRSDLWVLLWTIAAVVMPRQANQLSADKVGKVAGTDAEFPAGFKPLKK